MSLQKLISNYAEFNYWANKQFIDWLSTKPDELLLQEVPSSSSSILKTMHHIWGAQEYWYGVIAEIKDFQQAWTENVCAKDEIFNRLLTDAAQLSSFVKSLSEDDLVRDLKIDNQWMQCELPRYEYVQHIVNHGTYHRGQIVTIGRNIGITDAPMTDYNVYNLTK